MNADQRNFAYPLEPQLQRLRWRLDERLAALAAALSAADAARNAADALAAEVDDVAKGLAQAGARALDLTRARHALDYLASLHGRRAAADRQLRSAEQQATERRAELAGTQTELEGLERDRGAALAEHVADANRRHQRDVDQDWTARASWRERGAAASEAAP